MSQSTEIHTSVNTVAYHSIRKAVPQSIYSPPQSMDTGAQTRQDKGCNDPGISL